MGAKWTPEMSIKNTHCVSATLSGDKVLKAADALPLQEGLSAQEQVKTRGHLSEDELKRICSDVRA